MADDNLDSLVLSVRLSGALVTRLNTIVADRKQKALPAPLSRNTVIAQMIERACRDAERER